MDFSLLTYNTLFSDAVSGLQKIVSSQHPDFLCLQEVDTTEETFERIEKLGYKLADYSNVIIQYGHIFGVATFYNPDKFDFSESKVIFLPKGMLDIFAYLVRVFKTGKKARTILRTEFLCKKNKKKLSIYNIHLTPYGTNSIRTKQLQTALFDVSRQLQDEATILTGDFNYPYNRKKLEMLMSEYSFKEATNSILFTTLGATPHYTFFGKLLLRNISRILKHKLKNDYIFYKNCISIFAKKLDVPYSDHYPVFAVFKLK